MDSHLASLGLVFFFLAALCSMQRGTSLTRDRIHAPYSGSLESFFVCLFFVSFFVVLKLGVLTTGCLPGNSSFGALQVCFERCLR